MATAASSFPSRVLARLRHTGHRGAGQDRPAVHSEIQHGEHRACHGGHCPGPCVRTARPRPGKGRAGTARPPPRPRPRGSQSRVWHSTAGRERSHPSGTVPGGAQGGSATHTNIIASLLPGRRAAAAARLPRCSAPQPSPTGIQGGPGAAARSQWLSRTRRRTESTAKITACGGGACEGL